MAAKKPEATEPESSDFATQKIDREELMAEINEQKQRDAATQKIDDSSLEAAVAKSAMDSGATMKVSEAELKLAMEEGIDKAKESPVKVQEKGKPAVEDQEKGSIFTKLNPTVAAIIGGAIILAACICGCVLLAAVYFYRTGF